MIVLKPVGGLCNRLRAISSFIDLCEEINVNLQICWKNNLELRTEFDDLFQPIRTNGIKVEFIIEGRDDLKFSDRQMNFPRQWIYNNLLKIYQHLYFDPVYHSTYASKLVAGNYDFRQLKNYRKPYIATWNKVLQKPVKKSYFQPKNHILDRIDQETRKFNSFTVGVHIRRSDHTKSIKESPLELFIRRMEQEIKDNTKTNFYVASDSSEVKAKLKSAFGHRILTQNEKSANRQSKQGMVEALVDLYSLSSTHKIFGSSSSSFAVTAAEFTDIPYQEIKL